MSKKKNNSRANMLSNGYVREKKVGIYLGNSYEITNWVQLQDLRFLVRVIIPYHSFSLLYKALVMYTPLFAKQIFIFFTYFALIYKIQLSKLIR